MSYTNHMNTSIRYFRAVIGACCLLLALPYPGFAEDATKSVQDKYELSKTKDPIDGGWLPNITGLPNEEEVDGLTKHVTEVMQEEKEGRCNAIDSNLRILVFQNFVIYQYLANKQGVYFNEKLTYRYAHTLAMILKESNGDTTNVTDMTGRSVPSKISQINLDRWKNVLKQTMQSRVKFNYQTNFGLTQLSADRLFVAFSLAKGQGHNKDFLEGKYGAKTPKKVGLDTAIAIRRLIWLYQDFAQGRLTQNDGRIHQEDIYKPDFNQRYQTGLKMALLYCGTRYMFKENQQYHWTNEFSSFEDAVASIAYCKLGNPQTGYGRHEIDEKCFAEWVTLCPALNVSIALITPLQYFQTRGEKPVCEATFNKLLIKKPETGSTSPQN